MGNAGSVDKKNYDWILSIKAQCEAAGVPFAFRSTGSRFVKDGVLRKINPKMQHRTAREMNINTDSDLSGESE